MTGILNSGMSQSALYEHINVKISTNYSITVAVLYGCETWSLTLREEHRLKVFEDRVLREIFWPKRGELTVEWRRLHNEELYDL